MLKKAALSIMAVMLVLGIAASALATTYLGNPKSMKFHYYDCRTIKHHGNFVQFSSRDEAVNAGYVPCGVCKP